LYHANTFLGRPRGFEGRPAFLIFLDAASRADFFFKISKLEGRF